VQLSQTGKAQLGHLSKNVKNINVSLKGKITHSTHCEFCRHKEIMFQPLVL